jgi:hypothetical protein
MVLDMAGHTYHPWSHPLAGRSRSSHLRLRNVRACSRRHLAPWFTCLCLDGASVQECSQRTPEYYKPRKRTKSCTRAANITTVSHAFAKPIRMLSPNAHARWQRGADPGSAVSVHHPFRLALGTGIYSNSASRRSVAELLRRESDNGISLGPLRRRHFTYMRAS